MSRTYKDVPYKFVAEYTWRDDAQYKLVEYQAEDYVVTRDEDCYFYRNREYTGKLATFVAKVQAPGVRTKKKKSFTDHSDWWYKSTPSHWTHQNMIVPKRAACRNWEKKVLRYEDLEEIPDCPDFGRKPHIYYW